jgi:hypothetical protein
MRALLLLALDITDSTLISQGNSANTGAIAYGIELDRTKRVGLTRTSVSVGGSNESVAIFVDQTSTTDILDLDHVTISVDAPTVNSATGIGIKAYGQKLTSLNGQIDIVNGISMEGIYAASIQSTVLVNNTVRLNSGGGYNVGIYLLYGGDLINNSVYLADQPTANQTYGIQCENASRLVNNLVVAGKALSSIALEVTMPPLPSPSPTPAPGVSVSSNALSASTCALHSASVCTSNLSTLNDCSSWNGCSQSSGNIVNGCGISSSDFHISAGSACQSSGTDPSAVYPYPFVDLDASPRPIGNWDIGADEIAN